MSNDNDRLGKSIVFDSPYEQYKERIGQEATIIAYFTEDDDEHDISEVGPMYRLRFDDGTEIDAWPEEVEAAAIAGWKR